MSRPVVTALLPVDAYHERYLLEAVASVQAQSSPDWRLIVITERRREAALRALLARALADPRISLTLNEGRRLGGALNTGMRRAATEFVAILLGDDLWASDAVAAIARHLAASPDADFLHSSRRYVDDDGRSISGTYRSPASVSASDFADGTPVKHLLCWRRELALSFGGVDESLSAGADDYDFPWSMAEHGARFAAMPECLYVYRDHRQAYRLTTHLPRSLHARELGRILRKHAVEPGEVRRRVAEASEGYLRQCLYATPADRLVKRVTGDRGDSAWREHYS